VLLLTGCTMAVNGTLSFATGDVVTLNNNGNYFQVQINVGSGGLLSASGATITAPVGNNTNGVNFANINVAAGGRVQASNTTFSVGQVSFAVGAALGAGDLNGDAFDTTLYVPAIGVQYLSGTGNSNLRFRDIYIQVDTLVNGQNVALNAIGTQTNANLRYVFPGNFTINQGASLAVGPNVPVLLLTGCTITVNGTLSFATGDVVTLNDNGFVFQEQINVGNGGLLQATGATITAPVANGSNGNNFANINVAAGGRLQASSTTFS